MINLLSSKIEQEIINHFEENIDLTEPKEDYECEFTFDGSEILVPYTVKHEVLTYKNEWISATKDGVSYSTEDTDHFKVRRMETNNYIPLETKESEYSKEEKLKRPKKRTIQQEIDSIIDRAKRVHEENIESSKAIDAHNDYLDLNEG